MHKGTSMLNDGGDIHGLQSTDLKHLGHTFQDAQVVT